MNNTKHTPGPWIIERLNSINENSLYITNGKGRRGEIAWVEPVLFPKQMIFNAKLIAAAPEMLEALQAVMNDSIEWDVIEKMVKAAIKKATQ